MVKGAVIILFLGLIAIGEPLRCHVCADCGNDCSTAQDCSNLQNQSNAMLGGIVGDRDNLKPTNACYKVEMGTLVQKTCGIKILDGVIKDGCQKLSDVKGFNLDSASQLKDVTICKCQGSLCNKAATKSSLPTLLVVAFLVKNILL